MNVEQIPNLQQVITVIRENVKFNDSKQMNASQAQELLGRFINWLILWGDSAWRGFPPNFSEAAIQSDIIRAQLEATSSMSMANYIDQYKFAIEMLQASGKLPRVSNNTAPKDVESLMNSLKQIDTSNQILTGEHFRRYQQLWQTFGDTIKQVETFANQRAMLELNLTAKENELKTLTVMIERLNTENTKLRDELAKCNLLINTQNANQLN